MAHKQNKTAAVRESDVDLFVRNFVRVDPKIYFWLCSHCISPLFFFSQTKNNEHIQNQTSDFDY